MSIQILLTTKLKPGDNFVCAYLKCNTICARTVFNHVIVPVVGVVFVEGEMEEANVPKQQ